jgi:hypothetical protein
MASLLASIRRASIARRLGSYRYSLSLDYFASVAWVLGRFDTGVHTCVESCNKPCASFDTARRFDGADCSLASILGRLDRFWSIKMLMLRSVMLAD